MSSKPKATANAPPPTADEQLERMGALGGAAFEIFSQACRAYTTGVAQLNGELMNFVDSRLSRDAKLGNALSKCHDWSDAVDLQQDWARQATQDYLAETSKLMELGSMVARDSWQPVYERANQALAEFSKPMR